jgi:hypothetical protein
MKAMGVRMGKEEIAMIHEKLDKVLESTIRAETKIGFIEKNLCEQTSKNYALEKEINNLKMKVVAFGAFFGGASGLGATYIGKLLFGV